MFGGADGSRTNDAWTLNLTSYTWKQLTTSGTKPIRRRYHSSILYNKHMIIFGGDDDAQKKFQEELSAGGF